MTRKKIIALGGIGFAFVVVCVWLISSCSPKLQRLSDVGLAVCTVDGKHWDTLNVFGGSLGVPFTLYGKIQNFGPHVWTGWVEFRAVLFDLNGKRLAERNFIVRCTDGWPVYKRLPFSVSFEGVDEHRVGNYTLYFVRGQRQVK